MRTPVPRAAPYLVAASLAIACAAAPRPVAQPPSASAVPPPRPLPRALADAPRVAAPPAPWLETRLIGESAPQGSSVVFAGGRGAPVDLDLQGVDIADVCRLLADVGRVNIVVADGVHGAVTLRLRRVPWDRALEVILQTKGLRAESAGDIIIVRGK